MGKKKQKAKQRQEIGGKKKSGSAAVTMVAENRKARHRYEILDSIECGMMLMGSEVKSMREGKLSLDEAYIRVKDNELWLIGSRHRPLQQCRECGTTIRAAHENCWSMPASSTSLPAGPTNVD